MLKFLITTLTICVLIIAAQNNLFSLKTQTISSQIEAVVLGPLPGEYGYATEIILTENGVPININQLEPNTPNIITTLNYLDKYYPKINKIGLVVGWYVNSVNAEQIQITPKVDSRINAQWRVGGFSRTTAHLMNKDSEGNPLWTGTPTDKSVVEFTKLLYERGIAVTIYPFLFVDTPDKPWRGLIKAHSKKGVDNFFNEYEKFILHYATLESEGTKLKDIIQGFLVGSELEGLLKYQDNHGQFIAVDKMVNLIRAARGVLGSNIKISYAANWSEYHHTEGGWYHLDKLWADQNVDFVGIDAYFPLTNHLHKQEQEISAKDVEDGWSEGENYDYYLDEKGDRKPIDNRYAIQNIVYWWSSPHINPNSLRTTWEPKMKPIIFTEIGFTPLQGTANAPYHYVDVNPEALQKSYDVEKRVSAKNQYEAVKGTIQFIEKLNIEKETKGMLLDVYWYNIDPRPDNYDWLYNHEIKVSDYEKGDQDLDGVNNKTISDILRNARAKLR